MNAARIIREARHDSGVTQTELAERLGTTQSAIARLERDGSNPRVVTLARALEALGQEAELRVAPLATASDVDLGQLAAMRRLTPSQRIHAFEGTYEDARAFARAGRRARRPLA